MYSLHGEEELKTLFAHDSRIFSVAKSLVGVELATFKLQGKCCRLTLAITKVDLNLTCFTVHKFYGMEVNSPSSDLLLAYIFIHPCMYQYKLTNLNVSYKMNH